VYKVMFAETNAIPVDIRAELCLRLDEIATTLANVPPEHIVWASMEDSEAHIDVRGWHFSYRVERGAKRITVVRALPFHR
jgi:hypothetical protein